MSWLSELFGGGGDDPVAAGAAASQLADVQRRTEEIAQEKLRQANEANQRYVERVNEEYRQKLEDDQRQAMMQQVLKQFEPTPRQVEIKTRQDELALQDLERQQRERETEAQRGTLRESAMRGLAPIFGPEFERSYIPETLDDPYIAQAYAQQRSKADEFLNNLLKRNVITQTGYEGGQRNLEEQAPRVREQLSGIGQTLLESERAGLRDVAGRARGAASALDVGQAFDPSVYGTEASTRASEFGKSLPDKFASQIPGDLFDVSSLPDIAGAAQFAQNLTPTGFIPPSTTEEDTTGQRPVQRRTSTVF